MIWCCCSAAAAADGRSPSSSGIADLADRQYHASMVTMTLKVDDNMASWLRREAKRLGRPASALVRDAIIRLRDGQGDGSVLSLVDDTMGELASGTADLASNKR